MGILEANVPKSIGRSIYRNRLNRIKKIVYTHEQANWRTAQSQCLKRNWKLIEFRLNYTSREKKKGKEKKSTLPIPIYLIVQEMRIQAEFHSRTWAFRCEHARQVYAGMMKLTCDFVSNQFTAFNFANGGE